MADACWRTLDGRQIPIRFMTTTHLGNAMTHQVRVRGEVYPPLLEEWTLREKEGIYAKARRFVGRVLGNYYKGSSKYGEAQKKKFQELNDQLVAEKNKRYDEEFLSILAKGNRDDAYVKYTPEWALGLDDGKSTPVSG